MESRNEIHLRLDRLAEEARELRVSIHKADARLEADYDDEEAARTAVVLERRIDANEREEQELRGLLR